MEGEDKKRKRRQEPSLNRITNTTPSGGGFRPTKKQPMPGEKMLWTGVRLLAAQMKAYQAAKERYGTG